jgi:hypothetical protein
MYFSRTLIFLSTLAASTLALPSHKAPAWQSLAPIPLYPRQEHTTVFLPPHTIAIIGGIIPSNDTNLAIPVITTPLTQFYSILTNSWTTRAPLPKPLNHINAAVVNGKIYVLGGLAENVTAEGRAWRAVGDAWMYDPRTDAWTSLPSLPAGEERGSAAVGVYDNKTYLAGGLLDLELFGSAKQSSVAVFSVFDTVTRRWLRVPSTAKFLPEGRDHLGSAVVGSKMYCLGGRIDGQENVRDTVFVLDLRKLSKGWQVSSARVPTARGGVAAGVVGSKVYVMGGEGNKTAASGVFNQVEAYDTVNDTWEDLGKMRLPRHGTYAVGVGEGVYVPGGGVQQSGGPVADFDVFLP